MTAYPSAAAQRPRQRLLLCLASTALLASGCSNITSTAPGSSGVNSAAKLTGAVHGGNQPVANATVSLYFAGQAGIASPATLVATTKSLDDGAGSFSFTRLPDTPTNTNTGTTNSFSCPTAGGTPYVYVVARGGNTLNTHDLTVNNPASVFIAPLGFCNALTSSTFVSMSEAVTAATVAAVHQFMNGETGDIGSDGILVSYDGLANSFNLVSNLVDLSTGQTRASRTLAGVPSTVSVTATPEQSKLNQIGNILSACINTSTGPAGSSSSAPQNACDVLLASAVPPSDPTTTSTPTATFTAATDVLQAAYFLFTNPTDTTRTDTTSANLTKLYNLSPATGAPYQPTLTAVPSDWSIGIRYTASGTCGTGSNALIANAYDLNVDGTGNLWIANNQLGGSSLAELSATGFPKTCLPIGGPSHGATIDSSGNIYVGDSQNNIIYRYDPTGTTPTLQFPTPVPPYALTANGVGDVFFSSVSPASVLKITSAATATSATTPDEISTDVGSTPAHILVDGNGAIWASTRNSFVSLITPGASGAPGVLNGYLTTHVGTPSPSYGISATAGLNGPNGLYISSQEGSNMIDEVFGSGTNYSTATGFPTVANAAGLNVPSAIALDGSQNIWAANDQPDSGTNLGSVSELTQSGLSLSTDGTVNGGFQKDPLSFLHGRTIAIDQSGNVWIGNDGSPSVTQIVGGAVPVFQPFAVGLANHRFQTRP